MLLVIADNGKWHLVTVLTNIIDTQARIVNTGLLGVHGIVPVKLVHRLITFLSVYFGADPPMGSNIDVPSGLILPPAAIPMPP